MKRKTTSLGAGDCLRAHYGIAIFRRSDPFRLAADCASLAIQLHLAPVSPEGFWTL